MGDIADMMLDGTLCECCGVLMEDLIDDASDELEDAPGHPRRCADCGGDDDGNFSLGDDDEE